MPNLVIKSREAMPWSAVLRAAVGSIIQFRTDPADRSQTVSDVASFAGRISAAVEVTVRVGGR